MNHLRGLRGFSSSTAVRRFLSSITLSFALLTTGSKSSTVVSFASFCNHQSVPSSAPFHLPVCPTTAYSPSLHSTSALLSSFDVVLRSQRSKINQGKDQRSNLVVVEGIAEADDSEYENDREDGHCGRREIKDQKGRSFVSEERKGEVDRTE